MSKIFMLDAEQVAELERSSRNEVVEWLYEAVRLNPGIPSEALVDAVNQWLGNPDREVEEGSYAEADLAGLGDIEFVPLGEDEEGDALNPADVDVNEASEESNADQEDAAIEVLTEEEGWDVEVPDLEDTVEFSPLDLEEVADVEVVEPVEVAAEEESVEEIDEDERILVPMDEDFVVEVAPNDSELALQEAADDVLQESISEAAQQRLNIRSILKDASALDRSSR